MQLQNLHYSERNVTKKQWKIFKVANSVFPEDGTIVPTDDRDMSLQQNRWSVGLQGSRLKKWELGNVGLLGSSILKQSYKYLFILLHINKPELEMLFYYGAL